LTRHFFSCMRWILLFIKQIKFKQKKNIHYKYFSDNINCRYFHKCCFNKNMCEKSALNNAMIKEALSTLRVLCISTMSVSLSLSLSLYEPFLNAFAALWVAANSILTHSGALTGKGWSREKSYRRMPRWERGRGGGRIGFVVAFYLPVVDIATVEQRGTCPPPFLSFVRSLAARNYRKMNKDISS